MFEDTHQDLAPQQNAKHLRDSYTKGIAHTPDGYIIKTKDIARFSGTDVFGQDSQTIHANGTNQMAKIPLYDTVGTIRDGWQSTYKTSPYYDPNAFMK